MINLDMRMMKRKETLTYWTTLNVLWWFLSIFLAAGCRIDINPWMDNGPETILNITIFVVGIILILLHTMPDSEEMVQK